MIKGFVHLPLPDLPGVAQFVVVGLARTLGAAEHAAHAAVALGRHRRSRIGTADPGNDTLAAFQDDSSLSVTDLRQACPSSTAHRWR